LLRLCKKRRETDRFFETIFEKKKNTIFMWEFFDKIKCKMNICCRSKCSYQEPDEKTEEKIHYDYYSQKPKRFLKTTRSL